MGNNELKHTREILAGVDPKSVLSFFFFFLNREHFLFSSLFFFKFYLWLRWVFVSVRGLSLVVASGGHSSSRPLLLQSTGSRRAGPAIVAHGPSRSAACESFPDQGSNPCPLHWQADSQPLRHQGSPSSQFLSPIFLLEICICSLLFLYTVKSFPLFMIIWGQGMRGMQAENSTKSPF